MRRLYALIIALILVFASCIALADEDYHVLNDPAITKDGIKVTMLSVKESSGSGYWTPESGNVFVLVEFLIENNSKEELNVSTMLSFEAYVDDFAVDYSFSAILACKNALDVTIKSGKKAQGQMGFEVKKGWKTIEIEYETSWLFGETVTFKYTKGASNVNTSSDGLGTVYVQAGTNARTQPSSDSSLAAYIDKGGNYTYYSLNSGWYYIKLNDGSFSYIKYINVFIRSQVTADCSSHAILGE